MSKKKIDFDNSTCIKFNNDYIAFIGSNFEEASKWYLTGFENFKTCKVLLSNNRLAHCVFFIQQCAECLTKAFLLSVDLTSLDTLKNISHSPESAFEAIYSNLGVTDMQDLADCSPIDIAFPLKIKKVISKWYKLISDVQDKIINTEKYIANFEISDDAKSFFNFPKDNDLFTLPKFIKDPLIQTCKINLFKNYSIQIFIQNCLYLFARLMKNTETNTRYPDNNLIMPDEVYTDNLKEDISSLLNCLDVLFSYIKSDCHIQFNE